MSISNLATVFLACLSIPVTRASCRTGDLSCYSPDALKIIYIVIGILGFLFLCAVCFAFVKSGTRTPATANPRSVGQQSVFPSNNSELGRNTLPASLHSSRPSLHPSPPPLHLSPPSSQPLPRSVMRVPSPRYPYPSHDQINVVWGADDHQENKHHGGDNGGYHSWSGGDYSGGSQGGDTGWEGDKGPAG